MATGLNRTRDGWANQHSARVRYADGKELDVPEDQYRSQGYLPPFDKLPWTDGNA